VFVFNVVLGLGLWALLAVSAPWLGRIFRSQDVSATLPVAGLTFLLGSLGTVSQALLIRDLRFRTTTAIDAVYTSVTVLSALALAWMGYGFWSLIWSQVLANLVQATLRLILGGWWPAWSFSWPSLRELLSFGVGLHVKRLLDAAALNVDNLAVGRTLGIAPLGFYDKGFTMMNRAVNILSAAGYGVSFRIFALIHGDDERFRLAYRKVVLSSTFVSYSAMALLGAVAPELFHIMFGPQWGSAVAPFQVLCAVGALKTLNVYVSSAVQSAGKVWGEVQRQVVYLALIVAGVAVGSWWGLVGAAAGVLAATVVMSALMLHMLHAVTRLSWRDLLGPQIPSLACAALLLSALTVMRMMTVDEPMTTVSALAWLVEASLLALVLCLGFVRWSTSKELTAVYEEAVMDLAPRWAGWLGVGSPSGGKGGAAE
jgi:O-antigen/teichoic acid export membrane protein